VSNGVDADDVSVEDLRAFVDQFQLAKSFPVLAMVGVMVWDWKAAGMKILLSALPTIQKQYPDVALVLAGDGAYRKELEDYAAQTGCARSVVFTGNLDNPAIALAAANIYVHVAANEACPMAVLEAMQAGLPVVASREGGTGELIDDQETGLLVASDPTEVAGGIIRLLQDHRLAALLGCTAKARCNAAFTWEAICTQYLALYARI
jgi:glycosyltransferase involved in cell wall biosynthesis